MFSRQIFSPANSTLSYSSTFVRLKHIYKSPPLTLSQLEECLIKSAVHDKGLLIVNKPVGVCFEKGLVNADSQNPSRSVCLKSALPALKQHFKVSELFNVNIPERNISGVTIFAESETLAKEILKWRRVMREAKIEADIYHTVVVGHPPRDRGHFEGSISLITKNGVKRIVLSEDIVKNRVKRGEEKRVNFSYYTLAKSDEASFVEVHSSRTKWNSVRAYLAKETLTPILGDSLYGMYVQTLLGRPVLIDVFSKPQLPLKKLPENLKKQLGISNRQDVEVPLHLHLNSVKIMLNKKQRLEYSMPQPDVFRWTLEQLGLTKEPSLLTASAIA